ncbi:HD domain-containing protein [candidate division WOR-3 bacterium]|nr:HD domain-containing protein [candidate division WOR-3 bacterium]
MRGNTDYRFIFPENPEDVLDRAVEAIKVSYKKIDVTGVKKAFKDVVSLFDGNYPGYRKCTTRYHDLSHSTSVFLASARLIDGAASSGLKFKDEQVNLALISSLFHDIGYIQKNGENKGTGAKFSRGHEERSISFASSYLGERGYTDFDRMKASQIIASTILELPLKDIPFPSDDLKILGKIVGTADLVAQMADRFYLEKLLFLFREFTEAGIPGFPSEIDLLKNTETFYRTVMKSKIYGEYEGVFDFMELHFLNAVGDKSNPYAVYMDKNIDYLNRILTDCEEDYRSQLRRGGIVQLLKREESINPIRRGFKV